jgi:hypothetical protein
MKVSEYTSISKMFQEFALLTKLKIKQKEIGSKELEITQVLMLKPIEEISVTFSRPMPPD